LNISKKHLGIILILIFSIITASILILLLNQGQEKTSSGDSKKSTTVVGPPVRYVGGTLTQNETWSGHIYAIDSVTVPEGITLTIVPGTFIEFRHYRGYKETDTVGLTIDGGTINATGTAEKQIWFTSDAEDPINGDWGGVFCTNTNSSIFKYVIVEFGIIGIELSQSNITISHSIIRWIHTEGIYSASSTGLFEYNRIYDNGYHDMSLENFNKNLTVSYNIFNGGHYGIYSESTEVNITGNYFVNYTGCAISGNAFSNLTIAYNRFENIMGENISLDETSTNVTYGNGPAVPIPNLDFADPKPRSLDYVPGDPEDRYMYVYDSQDDTRKIIGRINETSFDWTLEYVNGSLWKFIHRSGAIGDRQDFIKINISTNETTHYGNDVIFNPNGLAYDGDYFWTIDIVLKKIFKFKINSSDYVEIHDSFDPPAEVGDPFGIATNGTSLFLSGSDGSKIFELDKSGTLLKTINLIGGNIQGVFTWTGSHFWAASETILTKWYQNGTLIGKIYPAAEGSIGIAWDGTYLWTSQKTCEVWVDDKIFQIEILDDQYLLEN
jgi:hypothetical protein